MAYILLVDDDVVAVARNRAALEASGHDVGTARSARAALESVQRNAPDLVVLEAMLGGSLDGFDLAGTLAASRPTLPLIMLSRVDEHMGRAERASQDHDDGWVPVHRYLQKPVMSEVLAYEVDHLLSDGIVQSA